MSYSVCPRCLEQDLQSTFSVCLNCNYGLGSELECGVPIPGWALKHVPLSKSELAEVQEINFGVAIQMAKKTSSARVLQNHSRIRPLKTHVELKTHQYVM